MLEAQSDLQYLESCLLSSLVQLPPWPLAIRGLINTRSLLKTREAAFIASIDNPCVPSSIYPSHLDNRQFRRGTQPQFTANSDDRCAAVHVANPLHGQLL